MRGPLSPNQARVVVLLMALCFLSHLNRLSMAIAADERIMAQWGITPEKMGVIYSSFLICYSLAMIPGGWVIDKIGPARALVLMAAGSGFCGALTGLVGFAIFSSVGLWAALLAVRSVMGVLTTPLHPGSAQGVHLWVAPEKRTVANGLVTGAALLGIASTYHLFGFLIDRLDWPAAFVLTGLATIALSVVCHLLFPRERPVQAATSAMSGGAVLALLRTKSLLFLTLSYAAVGYFQYLFFYWMHYYFEHVLHLGKMVSRNYATVPTLAMAASMPLGGWLADRLSRVYGPARARRLVSGGGMVGSAFFLVMGVGASEPSGILLWFTLSLASVGISEGPFWLTATDLGERYGGTAAAIMNTGGNAVGLLAPLLTPVISQRFGWHWGLFLGAGVSLLGAVCWIWINPREERMKAKG